MTVVEIAACTLVLGIAITGIVSNFGNLLHANQFAKKREGAQYVATRMIETLKFVEWDDLNRVDTWTNAIFAFDEDGNPEPDVPLTEAELRAANITSGNTGLENLQANIEYYRALETRTAQANADDGLMEDWVAVTIDPITQEKTAFYQPIRYTDGNPFRQFANLERCRLRPDEGLNTQIEVGDPVVIRVILRWDNADGTPAQYDRFITRRRPDEG